MMSKFHIKQSDPNGPHSSRLQLLSLLGTDTRGWHPTSGNRTEYMPTHAALWKMAHMGRELSVYMCETRPVAKTHILQRQLWSCRLRSRPRRSILTDITAFPPNEFLSVWIQVTLVCILQLQLHRDERQLPPQRRKGCTRCICSSF